MRVISIGSDRGLFEEGSPVHKRAAAYAAALGELHVVVFSLSAQGFSEVHAAPLHLYPTNSKSKLNYIRDAARIAIKIGGDVTTTQDPFESGLAGLKASRALQIPLHVQLHTDPFSPYFARTSFLNRVRLLIMPRVLRRAAHIRVVSERLKKEVLARFPRASVSVLPIYVDLDRFRAVQRNPEPGLVLWAGRFEPEKDPLLAIHAIAKVLQLGTAAKIKLVMLGKGSLEAVLKNEVKKLGVESAVEFPGWQDPLPYLSRASLALCTSKYEGYGISIIEALAAGVTVLSTDVGIAREAGARISSKEGFCETLIECLHAPDQAELKLPIPMTIKDYIEQYVFDINLAREPSRKKILTST